MPYLAWNRYRICLTTLFVGFLFLLNACQQELKSQDQSTRQSRIYQWKMVTSWPKNFPALGIAPERLAELVSEMSGGRLRIKVYAADELVPALGVFDAVSSGAAEMGHSAAYYWKGKIPAAQFFSSVPFGLTATEMNAWLYEQGGLELWQKLYDPYGILPVPGGNTGVQMAGWFRKKLENLEDIRGLKIRIPGIGAEVLQKLGAVTVSMSGGELFTALQTGAIEATEWVGPYNDLAFGLYKAAPYYYYPGWHEPGTVLEFQINKAAFNSLPKDLQSILLTAARAVNQQVLDEFTANNAKALNTLRTEYSIKVYPLPKDILSALANASDETLFELGETDDFSRKVYASFISFRRQMIKYNSITELAYLKARELKRK